METITDIVFNQTHAADLKKWLENYKKHQQYMMSKLGDTVEPKRKRTSKNLDSEEESSQSKPKQKKSRESFDFQFDS